MSMGYNTWTLAIINWEGFYKTKKSLVHNVSTKLSKIIWRISIYRLISLILNTKYIFKSSHLLGKIIISNMKHSVFKSVSILRIWPLHILLNKNQKNTCFQKF